MDVEQFKTTLREIDDLWQQDVLSESAVERFLLSHVPEFETNYELMDLIPRRMIDLLIRDGVQHLQHPGSMRMISGGRVVDLSAHDDLYKRLFDQWKKNGWIEVADDGTVTLVE